MPPKNAKCFSFMRIIMTTARARHPVFIYHIRCLLIIPDTARNLPNPRRESFTLTCMLHWMHMCILALTSFWFFTSEDFSILINWPASREKGPSDITNSVDKDQPLHVVENSYTLSNWCGECQKVHTRTRRGVGDAAAGLGLHFLHMSEDPFSHDAGQFMPSTLLKGHSQTE